MSDIKVLVTGAAGRVGKECVAWLAEQKGIFIRAASRQVDKLESLKRWGAHEIVTLDYADPTTYEKALEGINVIFSSSPDPSYSGHKMFIEYIKEKNLPINHIVRLSCMGAEQNTACYDHDKHVSNSEGKVPSMLVGYWMGEKCCIDTGIPVTALRGNFFMNHLIKNEVPNIEDHGFFKSPLGNTKNSFVCTNDIGFIAAKLIIEGPKVHGNKFYDITGPEPQSMGDVAETLSKVMGKKIEYRQQDFVEFEKDFGPARTQFFEYLRNGFYTRVAPDFYNLTGRRATTYYEYLTTKGKAGETGLEELYQAGVWSKGKDIMKGVKH
jgi:uncharacterized protein YbjT (DUF2867 family)